VLDEVPKGLEENTQSTVGDKNFLPYNVIFGKNAEFF